MDEDILAENKHKKLFQYKDFITVHKINPSVHSSWVSNLSQGPQILQWRN